MVSTPVSTTQNASMSATLTDASVYRAMWANTASRTIMTVWRISVNTERSVWMLLTDIPASVRRDSAGFSVKTLHQ
ncbi:hypothetical protein OYC64_009223 [Pagothenia borchgrevinki]|uniref:Uncharacterized protein n=1 Tax=Pagothenia borchgrevinki TaxID=8213 RepID=A0ABD2H4T7_PAGBO